MDVAAVAIQQAMTLQNVAMAMMKQNAQAQQSLISMIEGAMVPPSSRGGAVDISA